MKVKQSWDTLNPSAPGLELSLSACSGATSVGLEPTSMAFWAVDFDGLGAALDICGGAESDAFKFVFFLPGLEVYGDRSLGSD